MRRLEKWESDMQCGYIPVIQRDCSVRCDRILLTEHVCSLREQSDVLVERACARMLPTLPRCGRALEQKDCC